MNNPAVDERTLQLLHILADGKFHSGENMARELGISRASVFNALAKITDYGVVLQRIRGQGYRIAKAWQKLNRVEIIRLLGSEATNFDLEILPQADSSNVQLLKIARSGAKGGKVLAVEIQTSGRGRLGRNWHSGLGNALTFSLLWRFDCGLEALSGLSLAVGIALVRAFRKLGITGTQLKWPNDILTERGKLGGILLEAQGDILGPSAVVIGIGLNLALPDNIVKNINQPASALDEICIRLPTRDQLLAITLQELATVLRQFVNSGFASLRNEWERYHFYQNQSVRLHMPDGSTVCGIACGISEIGELCLETEQGIRYFNSGEVG